MANKYEKFNEPQRQLDLHDHTRDEAVNATRDFIDECVNDGIERVLIITGKGNHSSGCAIIKPTIKSHLSKSDKVGDYQSAKPNQGGEGAFFVRLTKN